jgi:hypothetical protein
VSGGGLLPSWLVLGAMLVMGTPMCAVVLARPASTRRIVSIVVSGQAACHAVLSLTAGHRGDPAGSGPIAAVGQLPVNEGPRVGSLQDHYEATTIGTRSAGPALSVPDPGAMLDHLPMFLAHAAVAVLVGLWLAAGERALWALLNLVFAAVVALLVLPTAGPLVCGRPTPVRRRPAALPSLARVSRCVVRRGPPALLAA